MDKWKKLAYWEKGIKIGIIIGLLLPLILLIVSLIAYPNEIYNNGSWQCTGWEYSATPCSFSEAMTFLFREGFLFYEFLFGIPSLIICPIVGLIIGLIVGKIKK